MFNNLSGDLMAHNARARKWKFAFHDMKIRMTDSTCCTFASPEHNRVGNTIHHINMDDMKLLTAIPNEASDKRFKKSI